MPWHAPVFLLNSRLGRFSAAGLCSPWRVTYCRHPLSRSYGVILPSSFSVNHSSPLGCSPRPPVSDYGTVNGSPGPRSFSWQCGVCTFGTVVPTCHVSRLSARADFPTQTSYTLKPAHPIAGVHSLLRPSAAHNGLIIVQEYQPDVHRLRLSASP